VARQGELFVSLMADIGIEVDFQAVDFGSVVVPNLLGQTFDMAGLSWSLGLPVDPDVTAFYTPSRDIPGAGFNFVSFYNEEMNDLLLEARQVAGCDVEQRAEIYGRVQEILFEELPYLYLYVGNTMFALQNNVLGFDPLPFSRLWNLDSWAVVESE
jgi:peptide/nickel transport system substrate-binding protein